MLTYIIYIKKYYIYLLKFFQVDKSLSLFDKYFYFASISILHRLCIYYIELILYIFYSSIARFLFYLCINIVQFEYAINKTFVSNDSRLRLIRLQI